MILLPAIDLYEQKGVRLFKGQYDQMTVYTEDPVSYAHAIAQKGASWIHLVDLEGARDGTSPNLDIIRRITAETGLSVETGGGIRSFETIETLLGAGVKRVIIGTRAIEDEDFLKEALNRYGDAVAVGVDARDGKVATHGWTATTDRDAEEFIMHLRDLGVSCVIATEISRDGAIKGTNRDLYRQLSGIDGINIIASGGVSSLDDICALAEIGVYGAILGKAMYTGAVTVEDGIAAAEGRL